MLSFPSQPSLRAELADWLLASAECLSIGLFGLSGVGDATDL